MNDIINDMKKMMDGMYIDGIKFTRLTSSDIKKISDENELQKFMKKLENVPCGRDWLAYNYTHYDTHSTIKNLIASSKVKKDGTIVTTLFDKQTNKLTQVKKCENETYDIEKAVCYCLLKHIGISPKEVNTLVQQIEDKRIADEKKENKREFKYFKKDK